MNDNIQIIISCEHATSEIPTEYASLFDSKQAKSDLKSHLGFDEGAADMAAYLHQKLNLNKSCFAIGKVSRLLIDLNRSENHRNLFSKYSHLLSKDQKQQLLTLYHRPYRQQIQSMIKSKQKNSLVIHLSIHSFTPMLHQQIRKADVSILYDPKRKIEKRIASKWVYQLKAEARQRKLSLYIGRNQPYRGTADGCTTSMRRLFSPDQYAGFEIEVNQRLLHQGKFTDNVKDSIFRSLTKAITSYLKNGFY